MTRAVAIGCLLLGCGAGDPVLVVDLRTDIAPGTEMSAIRLTLEGESPLEVPAEVGRDYVRGVRIAELRGLPRGEVRFELDLLGVTGDRLVGRPVVVAYDGRRAAVTVPITRECFAVSCPGEGEPFAFTACVAGQCAPPECTEERDTDCDSGGECEDAEDCLPMFACATPTCRFGYCVGTEIERCPDGQVCVPDVGCMSSTPTCTGTACDCTTGECDNECEGCHAECAPGTTCRLRCPTGGCSLTCREGATCDLDCSGGGCSMDCEDPASCSFACPDFPCDCTGVCDPPACGMSCGVGVCDTFCPDPS